ENPLGAEAARARTDVIGTPGFMAPEQLAQKPLDARTDVFALGALLYYLATGKLAFEAESPYALLKQFKSQTPIPLLTLRPELSPLLESLVHDCLATAPELRPASAESVRERLRVVLNMLGVRDTRELLR